ncbi:MAG TPA: PRC-barrel domain-containing protein [Candidatus Limnocylindrales bacterium]|jgi:sporulation protein YlmC with PRC-barrel domain|nr:PRC-barrel domain-containing protein [Candidatus Limnocylindrales bacterium]
MRTTMTTTALEPLSQTRLDLVDPKEDVRGRKVFDRDGQEIGKVDDAFIDPAERRARFLSVKSGDFLGLGGKKLLIPIDAIASLTEDKVVINDRRDRIVGGPQVDHEFDRGPDRMADTANEDADALVIAVYEWYGVEQPYWNPTYQRPNWR